MRIAVVRDGLVKPFLLLAQSTLVEYQRTAVAALASFSLNHENKQQLVRDGALNQLFACCHYTDLEVFVCTCVCTSVHLSELCQSEASVNARVTIMTMWAVPQIQCAVILH